MKHYSRNHESVAKIIKLFIDNEPAITVFVLFFVVSSLFYALEFGA